MDDEEIHAIKQTVASLYTVGAMPFDQVVDSINRKKSDYG